MLQVPEAPPAPPALRHLHCAAAGAVGEGRRRPAQFPSHDGAAPRWRRLNGWGSADAGRYRHLGSDTRRRDADGGGRAGPAPVDLILHLAELAFLAQITMRRPPTFSWRGPRRGRWDDAAPGGSGLLHPRHAEPGRHLDGSRRLYLPISTTPIAPPASPCVVPPMAVSSPKHGAPFSVLQHLPCKSMVDTLEERRRPGWASRLWGHAAPPSMASGAVKTEAAAGPS